MESLQQIRPIPSNRQFIEETEKEILSVGDGRLNVHDMKENFDENHSEVTMELKATKDQFSKLKFNFLELETKEKFLQAILQNPDSLPPFDAGDILEQQVDAAKAKVKASKKQNDLLLEDITKRIASILKRIERHEQLKLIASKKVAELQQLEKEIEEMNKEIQESADLPPISLERAKSILEEQKLFIAELVAQQEERKARVAAVVQEIQKEEKNVSELKATVAKLQAEAQRVAELERGRDLALEARKNWLVNMMALVSKLSGFTVEFSDNNFELTIKFSLSVRGAVEEVSCVIVSDPSSGKFVGVQLENNTVPIQDIVDRGRETNDFTYVVTELQIRLTNFFKRSREFQDLEERGYAVEVNETKSLVKVTLNEGATVSFTLDLDYPRLATNFMLTQISGHRHFDSQSLHQRKIEVLKVQCLLEETRSCTTITEAVLYLQSYLPKLN